MANLLNSISSAFNNVSSLIETAMEKAIVRVSGQTTIDGFIFDIVDSETVDLTSDITDHYVEENYTVQDHIALRPEKITVKGYVAEIRDILPATALTGLTTIQSLASIGGFLPEFSTQATRVYAKIAETASTVGNYIGQAQNVFDILQGRLTTANRQQKAFATFDALWRARKLVSVECPYGVFTDMAIENVRAVQGGESRYVSDFVLTLKKIRKTTEAVPVTKTMYGRVSAEFAGVAQCGQSAGSAVNERGVSLDIGTLQNAFVAYQGAL